MNGKNKRPSCNCKEVEEKLISLLKDKENLLQMIRDLRKENERLEGELHDLHHRGSAGAGSLQVQVLIDINHGWERDYEELQMRYEMLSGEKKLLEEEEKELNERVGKLERRQGPLLGEITRLASALYTRNQGGCETHGEQYEILKTQITVYKEDFEQERRESENIHDEKEKLKRELEDAEEIIKKLTLELTSNDKYGITENGMPVRHSETHDEQYEPLKSQITVYKEDFERERHDRENIYEEKEKLKRELEDAKEIKKSNDDYGITENGMPVRHEEGYFTK